MKSVLLLFLASGLFDTHLILWMLLTNIPEIISYLFYAT
jgi:hypothetical protein